MELGHWWRSCHDSWDNRSWRVDIIDITFKIGSDVTGSIVNLAEIASATAVGPTGVSILMPNNRALPDTDSTADAQNSESPVDDVVDNSSGDEDDHDVANIIVSAPVDGPIPLAFTGSSSQFMALSGFLMMMIGLGFLVLSRRREEPAG